MASRRAGFKPGAADSLLALQLQMVMSRTAAPSTSKHRKCIHLWCENLDWYDAHFIRLFPKPFDEFRVYCFSSSTWLLAWDFFPSWIWRHSCVGVKTEMFRSVDIGVGWKVPFSTCLHTVTTPWRSAEDATEGDRKPGFSWAQPPALDSRANHLACFSSSVRWGA